MKNNDEQLGSLSLTDLNYLTARLKDIVDFGSIEGCATENKDIASAIYWINKLHKDQSKNSRKIQKQKTINKECQRRTHNLYDYSAENVDLREELAWTESLLRKSRFECQVAKRLMDVSNYGFWSRFRYLFTKKLDFWF